MLCASPYKRGVQEFGCGQCMSCRINARRLWSTRIQLEASSHVWNTFATLTYADKNLPVSGLSRYDYRSFTKGIGYRYFGVGEYGDVTGRAHYHFVLFGAATGTDLQRFLEHRWRRGHVHCIPFEPQLADYISGYTVKKMNHAKDLRLNGRAPEFATMSRRPAIGSAVVPHLAQRTREHLAECRARGDVVSTLRLNGKEVPCGRTLTEKTRAAVNLPAEFADRRGRLALSFATVLQNYPHLVEYKTNCRATQADRAKHLARRQKGYL